MLRETDLLMPVMPIGMKTPDIYDHVTYGEARRDLDTCGWLYGYDHAAEKYGIHVHIRAEDFPPRVDCQRYLFGMGTFRDCSEAFAYCRRRSFEVDAPSAGAILFYRHEFQSRHVGRVLNDNGLVESKWNASGSVYHHDWRLVPWAYGSDFRFLIPQDPELIALLSWQQ